MHISCIFRAYFVWLNFVLIETGVCVYQSRGFQTVAVCNKSCACILNCRECFKWCVCVSKWCMYVPRVCCTKWGECTDTNYDPHTHHCLCTRTNYDIHTSLFIYTHHFNTHTQRNYDSHIPLSFTHTTLIHIRTQIMTRTHHFSFTHLTLIHTRTQIMNRTTTFHLHAPL